MVCPSWISAEPSAHAAVIATSSSPCFFSQALNRIIGAPATRIPSTAPMIFRLVRLGMNNGGLTLRPINMTQACKVAA